MGFKVFVSAVDIQLGDAWLKEIENALEGSTILLSVCGPSSVRRPWLNFESGSGWSKGVKVVPICYKGLRKDKLPAPLHIFQAVELVSCDRRFVSCQVPIFLWLLFRGEATPFEATVLVAQIVDTYTSMVAVNAFARFAALSPFERSECNRHPRCLSSQPRAELRLAGQSY